MFRVKGVWICPVLGIEVHGLRVDPGVRVLRDFNLLASHTEGEVNHRCPLENSKSGHYLNFILLAS